MSAGKRLLEWVIVNGKRLIICSDCKEPKKHHAHGKCDGCYSSKRTRRLKQPNPIF